MPLLASKERIGQCEIVAPTYGKGEGKLFDFVAQNFPDSDTEDFIKVYMVSKTRKCIDEAKAYVNTMSAKELW